MLKIHILKKLTIICSILFFSGMAMAQTDTNFYKGLKNPTNFVITDAGNTANAQWYGYEGSKNSQNSDCGDSAHQACTHIAAENDPMEITTSGCLAGSTQILQELTAPSGMENYVWYKSASGAEGIFDIHNVPNYINFIQLTPYTNTDNTYQCRIIDFLLTEGSMAGQVTNEQVFRCDMTSRTSENVPFTTTLYIRIQNTKPIMQIDTLKSCDGDIHFTDLSYIPNVTTGCDTSITKWWFYQGSDTLSPIADSAVGGQADHHWDETGLYAVKVRTFSDLDPTCYTDSTHIVRTLGRPLPGYTIDPGRDLCSAETVFLHDTTSYSFRHKWIFYDYQDGQSIGADTVMRFGYTNDTISRVFTNYRNPIELVAYNGMYTYNANNFFDTIWCTASAFDTIVIFQNSKLDVTGDTVVCNGQEAAITVNAEAKGCRYLWYLDTNGNGFISEGRTLRTIPYGDTCTYYVKVISPTQCEAWYSVNAYRVNTKLTISRHDICVGDSVTLTADNAYTYSWSASPTDSSLDALLDSAGHGPQTITVTPKVTTVYTMVGHGTNDCNASPLTEQITIHPTPVATVETYPGFVDSDNPVVTLTDASPYSVRRVWYFNDGVAEEYSSPCYHDFGEIISDSTSVTLVAYNDLDCADTLDFKLPITQFTFYAPKAFTPESTENNTFSIYTANKQENFSIYIYDRMGRQVFSSQDLHFAWDGTTYDGFEVPQGTYVYVIRYRRPGTNDIATQKGTVTLIR